MPMTFSTRRSPRTSMHGATTIAADASERIPLPVAEKYTVALYPTDGATVTVELSASSDAAILAGTHKKMAWSEGSVTTDTIKVIDGPLSAVEISAADEAVDVEILTL